MHVIMIIKQQAKPFILLMQEGKFITHLVIGVRVRVTLCALLAVEAQRHSAVAVSSKAAQPAQVLGRLPTLATITFTSLLLELEVEYAKLESTLLAPTITRALPRLSFFLDRRSSLCLLL
jgi:hypothetical protein